MPVSMSQLTLPAFGRGLQVLSAVLDKAQSHAEVKKIDATVLLQARLYPDMLPFVRQVQIACDMAKGAVARLAGLEVPRFADDETTIEALHERIAKTRSFIGLVAADTINGTEQRDITVPTRDRPLHFEGQDYVLGFVLPNFYFHITTAYSILRHNGVELGKADYLGQS